MKRQELEMDHYRGYLEALARSYKRHQIRGIELSGQIEAAVVDASDAGISKAEIGRILGRKRESISRIVSLAKRGAA